MENSKELLNEVVARYGEYKGIIKPYEDQIKKDNTEIKRLMKELKVDNCESGGYVAKTTIAKSTSFDESKLIDKLDEMGGIDLGIIKMKPYVDIEVLENAIYNGVIDASDLADCKVTTETLKLTISKVKEK